MPEPLRVRDCVIVRGADKGYIEYINKDNYVTVLFIFGRNIEVMPQNECCQGTSLEGTGLKFGHVRNISSAPNQHTLLRISSQIT